MRTFTPLRGSRRRNAASTGRTVVTVGRIRTLGLALLVVLAFALVAGAGSAAAFEKENFACSEVNSFEHLTFEAEFDTACGDFALNANTSGYANTANGYLALEENTKGSSNTADGVETLFHNTTGNDNLASGEFALADNTTGEGNTAVGNSALVRNTTGLLNVALGYGAGESLTTGFYNVDISNTGVAGEQGTIRIGTEGNQTSAYMAGIWPTPLSGSVCDVKVNSSGQLGCNPGESGESGPTGPAGPEGKEGKTGATGPAGPEGKAGQTGATGPAGSGVVGGGIGGGIGASSFNMSLYAQATATPMIQAGTLRNFTVHFTANVSANTVLTVQKNGASTAITCTVLKSTNTCTDATHSVAFAASDTILVHATYSGANSGTNPSWSATYP